MTKKQFEVLAIALKAQKPAYTPHDDPEDHGAIRYEQWVADVNAIMEVCAFANSKFSKGKFLAACGVANILDK